MTPLRVAINTLSVTHHNEGIRTLLKGLVPALVRNGSHHRYRLICSRANAQLFSEVADAVDQTVLRTSRRRPLIRIWHDQVTVPRLVWQDTDVLFTPSSVGSLAARPAQVVAMPAHLALPSVRSAVPEAKLSLPHQLYYGPIMRVSHRLADAVTPISSYLAERLVSDTGLAPERVLPILCGIDTKQFDLQVAERSYALFVGTLYPYKNAIGSVDAFALARPFLPKHYRLLVVGRDPDGAQLPHLTARAHAMGVADSVDFLGSVTDDRLNELYLGASVVLLPSRCEGFGLPVLEAMARGVPVIASNRTSLPEVVADAGLLVDPDCPADLAHLLATVSTDAHLRASLRRAGRQRAEELSWDRAAISYVALFDRLGRNDGPKNSSH